jgi:hypothetical protein
VSQGAHTPGPWSVDYWPENVPEYAVIGPELRLVANLPDRISDSTTTANAYLISAAPDLLAACRDLADWVRRRCPADDWPVEYTRASRAIQRAEGSPS